MSPTLTLVTLMSNVLHCYAVFGISLCYKMRLADADHVIVEGGKRSKRDWVFAWRRQKHQRVSRKMEKNLKRRRNSLSVD